MVNSVIAVSGRMRSYGMRSDMEAAGRRLKMRGFWELKGGRQHFK